MPDTHSSSTTRSTTGLTTASTNNLAINSPDINSPDINSPAKSESLFHFDDLASAQDALNKVCQSAQRHITIFSQQLSKALFTRRDTIDAISKLARKHRNSHVRILVQNSQSLVSSHHDLVTLSQRLPSHFTLRVLTEDYPTPDIAYCIADMRGLFYLKSEDNIVGFYHQDSRAKAKHLLTTFDHLWINGSQEDTELKILTW